MYQNKSNKVKMNRNYTDIYKKKTIPKKNDKNTKKFKLNKLFY